MYTVHFLNVPAPWGGNGYDPVPSNDLKASENLLKELEKEKK